MIGGSPADMFLYLLLLRIGGAKSADRGDRLVAEPPAKSLHVGARQVPGSVRAPALFEPGERVARAREVLLGRRLVARAAAGLGGDGERAPLGPDVARRGEKLLRAQRR